MGAATPWIIAGSSVLGAIGSIKTASANAAAANANALIARNNAIATEEQGIAAGEAQQRDTQRRLGALVAAGGASGVDTSQGSFADVLAESARNATLDALTLKYNYKLRQMGYQTQAGMYDAEAKNATTAGYLSAAGQLASGAAGAYKSSSDLNLWGSRPVQVGGLTTPTIWG